MKTNTTTKIEIDAKFFSDIGEHVQKVAYAAHVISTMLHDSETAKENGGNAFNGYQTGGLLTALQLISDDLAMTGERIAATPGKLANNGGAA